MNQKAEESTGPALDMHLEVLLSVVLGREDENHGASMDIALVTAGGLISGSVVTRRTWHLRLADRLAESGSTEIAQAFRVGEENISMRLREDRDEKPKAHRRYINLIDVVVVQGGEVHRLNSLRVDMREIIGWDIAKVTVS